ETRERARNKPNEAAAQRRGSQRLKRGTTREDHMTFIQSLVKGCCLFPLQESVICFFDTSNTGDPLASKGQRLTQQRL
ncbi:MAG: hypothetical protein AB8B45_01850, partial [Prochlorococcus sp.]